MTPAAALFVTLEGIEGSGKSTQVHLLSGFLSAAGVAHILTREPGGTTLGDAIRRLLLQPRPGGMAPLTELLLYDAARVQHLSEIIEPALASGRTVLCDRYKDATVAYQGHGRGLPLEVIGALHALAPLSRQPDLTFILDIDPELALSRARVREERTGEGLTRFEDEPLEFHHRVREGYRAIAAAEPGRVLLVDAAGERSEVHARLRDLLARRLGLGG